MLLERSCEEIQTALIRVAVDILSGCLYDLQWPIADRLGSVSLSLARSALLYTGYY